LIGQARKDFQSLLSQPGNIPKFALLLAVGMVSILLFAFGLGKRRPVVIAGVLNLDPFWAALVAFTVVGKMIATLPWTFGICLAVAFTGALLIAVSQSDSSFFHRSGLRLSSGPGSRCRCRS
jgi:drug/metabolite transporter (DMT)-like permease